ncbi:zinc transporter ZntB [Kushneria marisflavi]|uniref:Zinc transporter ZntB n=1 Tax=Kushneria marisflavi TaxID=157779 RepID=A0A240US48_9GAMM|nr:zinc transporter ZntB [Kushneria marisflavi]ART63935.1 zinc transporter ZntB [Kushneria marisflavi]RKD85655.1 zinc transporter [Kushneria marisflavi]
MSSASTSSFVVAYRLDGEGSGTPLDNEELSRVWQHDEAPLWMHLDFTHKDVDHFLGTIAELDEDIIEALTEEDTRPRVAMFKAGRITTLRGVNLNPGADPDDMISLRVWLTENRLITVRRRPLQSITRVRAYLDAGEGARNVGELMAGMADTLVDRVGDLTHQIDDALGELEERQTLKDSPAITNEELTDIRQPLITLRRFMEPQYHCLARLAEDDIFDETARLWLREASNQLFRYVEDFRAMQERALVLQEQLSNLHNERLNERMYLMSIITAVFLPLTFLTGLLGINVGGIPGASSPAGFAVVVVLSMLVGAGVMALLKKWRWW